MPRIALLMAIMIGLQTGMQPASAETPVYSEEQGVAIGGYDTVAFFVDGQAVLGDSAHAVMWKGVVWHFVSSTNRRSFEANPRAYAPRFGGYCAYAVSQGYLAAGSPIAWEIIDGKLFLLHSPQVYDMWRPEAAQLIPQARGNWPAVLNR